MIDVDTIILENGVEYTLIDVIFYNDQKYHVLCNISKPSDFCIRKEVEIKSEIFLSKLDDENEFDEVLPIFVKKNSHK